MFDIINCKKKKICLIDVDSSIPNLALMKISSYFKNNSKAKVDFKKLNYTGYSNDKKNPTIIDGSEYDKVFVSTIFTCNKGLVNVNNCKQVFHGGTGHDYSIILPDNIEHIYPDYSLYPENQYSMGFLTRGCIRNCEFCFVPKKEGLLKLHSNLNEFYNPDLPKIMLLDNNFLASKYAVDIFNQLIETRKKITFKQGLDFRLLTKDKAKILSKLNYDGEFIFAFDNIKDKPLIEKNINLWKNLVNDWRSKFFVLVGYNSTLQEDLDRVLFLKKNKFLPYIMRFSSCYSSPNRPFYTDLAAWCNQPGLFKNMPFKEFVRRRHSTKERFKETMEIINKNNLNKYINKL